MTTDRLTKLLAAWAKGPSAALGDDIVAEGQVVADAVATFETTVRPAAVTSLLAELTKKGAPTAKERVAMVAKWPADPRVDRWAAGLYVEPPWTSTSSRPFWTALQPITARIRDPRAIATLREARKALGDKPWQVFLARQLDKALEATGDVEPPAPAPSPKKKPLTSIDALVAAVLAKPGDDAPRLVLADALQEAESPWGELITLQLEKRELTAKEKKRTRELIKAATPDLLGPLAPVLKPSFEVSRGFLSRVALKGLVSNAAKVALAKTVGDARWGTIEHVEGPDDESVTTHPVMVSLRKLTNTTVPLATLAELPRLEELDVKALRSDFRELPKGAFPALKRFSSRADCPFIGTDVLDRLEVFVASKSLRSAPGETRSTLHTLLAAVTKQRRAETTLFITRGSSRDDPGSELRFLFGSEGLTVALHVVGSPRQTDASTLSKNDRPRMLADLDDAMDFVATLAPKALSVTTEQLPEAAVAQVMAAVARARGG